MPHLIDHEMRQAELAEATWRLLLREGVSAVSIRTVAAEAELSTGSLRHIFPTKADLLAFSMQLAHVRAAARIRAHQANPEPRTLVLSVLKELLPLDEERCVEMQVNVALIAEAPSHPRLREIQDESHQAIHHACRGLIGHLRDNGLTAPTIDEHREASLLHALVDGLALHLVTMNDQGSRDLAVTILETHIDRLKPASANGKR